MVCVSSNTCINQYVYDTDLYEKIKEEKKNAFSLLGKHVNIFEQDLCQLIEQLKKIVFLDIHGEIDEAKVEPYRSMVQRRFPNSQTDVEILRFRLWL